MSSTRGKEVAAIKTIVVTLELTNYLIIEGLRMDFRRRLVEMFKKGIKKG